MPVATFVKFEVGEKVRVRSIREIGDTLNAYKFHKDFSIKFNLEPMGKLCGTIVEIEEISKKLIKFKGILPVFHIDWIEKI